MVKAREEFFLMIHDSFQTTKNEQQQKYAKKVSSQTPRLRKLQRPTIAYTKKNQLEKKTKNKTKITDLRALRSNTVGKVAEIASSEMN